jgi:hypothetical protein
MSTGNISNELALGSAHARLLCFFCSVSGHEAWRSLQSAECTEFDAQMLTQQLRLLRARRGEGDVRALCFAMQVSDEQTLLDRVRAACIHTADRTR